MKKLALSIITGAAIALTPFSSFALSPMSDSGMKDATGQAGVTITLDDVVIEQWVGAATYTDDDGYDGSGGSIVISDKHTLKTFTAITNNDAGTYGYWNAAAGLSIDVGNCAVLAEGNNNNKNALDAATRGAIEGIIAGATDLDGDGSVSVDEQAMAVATTLDKKFSKARGLVVFAANAWADMDVTGVIIGLPTLKITTTEDTYNVGVKGTFDLNGTETATINSGQNFINVTKGASTMAILGGFLEIAAH